MEKGYECSYGDVYTFELFWISICDVSAKTVFAQAQWKESLLSLSLLPSLNFMDLSKGFWIFEFVVTLLVNHFQAKFVLECEASNKNIFTAKSKY